ncbi:MauE/DoxX family redox-associated membrane protein [Microbacterium thalassium]|uniref:Methylamine utilisation protein MauE domain-containing protein n=1 Tax=Microbacterium thalassium TaxID=362649 RepID=A0A7X0FMT1_9MICO|nr:MauE/DoxX family redox-associated membrane protein [Microbacterium thalassium]MBB6389876.1 hypothetical protein [Microbacterium thalassium]GLK24563.1 hypothetical protein GCM10017607_18810 [Microbacterium thalassium]
MPDGLLITFPLILAGVLVASGVAKLRTPDELSEWATLGVPAAFRRAWLLRLHPWGELALGIAVALLGGWLGMLASLAALALMLTYTVLVARAASRSEDASCACFGAQKRITRTTVVRNVWLTLLALASTAVIGATPLLGGAVAMGITDWAFLVGIATAAVTVALIMWPDQTAHEAPASPAATQPADDDIDGSLDYVRTRTPAVPVTLADGTTSNLRLIASHRPLLLLAVSTTCSSCRPVIEKVEVYRELMPELDVRFLLSSAPEDSALVELDEPQSLHDPHGYVRGSIDDWATPTAVLFGADGLLAGGPVTGAEEIDVFFDDVYESLHGKRPARQTTY